MTPRVETVETVRHTRSRLISRPTKRQLCTEVRVNGATVKSYCGPLRRARAWLYARTFLCG